MSFVSSAPTHQRTRHQSVGDGDPRTVLRWLYPAVVIGALWGVALTIVMLGFTTTADGHPYKHPADYWLVGLGIPLAISAAAVVLTIHRLASGRDGKRGRWGATIFVIPMLVFVAIFIDGLAQAESSSWGPTYLLCVAMSDIALGLLVSGLWRAELLPRWALALWFVGWFIGGPLGPPAGSLVLSAAYVVLAFRLRATVRSQSVE